MKTPSPNPTDPTPATPPSPGSCPRTGSGVSFAGPALALADEARTLAAVLPCGATFALACLTTPSALALQPSGLNPSSTTSTR